MEYSATETATASLGDLTVLHLTRHVDRCPPKGGVISFDCRSNDVDRSLECHWNVVGRSHVPGKRGVQEPQVQMSVKRSAAVVASRRALVVLVEHQFVICTAI